MSEDKDRARQILADLSPVGLPYEDWLKVGMVMKHLGFSSGDYDAWSRRDRDRYHDGEADRKWNSFRESRKPVTMASLVNIAQQAGVRIPHTTQGGSGNAFGWDDAIEIGASRKAAQKPAKREEPDTVKPIIDERWVEDVDIPAPVDDWQSGDLVRYLEALFESDEKVGIVADAWFQEDSGRWLPKKGFWDRSRDELCTLLRKAGTDIGKVIGDTIPEVGAWVRINPLDGNGCSDTNVLAYRHALIEADDWQLGKQFALIRELKLPCSAIVHSGKKSIHAIVRVDASTYDEYRTRVDYLYKVCQENGLKVDRANRNPSRLSRLPGVLRDGKPQYLIATHSGCPSWAEWEAWIEETQDDLPDPINLAGVLLDPPALADELIHGVLREGHKMRLTGSSKAGKSFALNELAVAIAEGNSWMGMQCKKGRVLYINFEIDPASCCHRFKRVYDAFDWFPENAKDIDVWNLRGHAIPLEKLAPKLIRRAAGRKYAAIIIDPIYKIQHGDENDAGDVARFCNQLDFICRELGAAIIDCHHHSKGTQGQKRAIDRGSGSGVFGRDPDAILDMIELTVTDEGRKQLVNIYAENALLALCRQHDLDSDRWDAESRRPVQAALQAFQSAFPKLGPDAANIVARIRPLAESVTGWRIETTLREFAPQKPVHVWFRHPVHVIDDTGILADAKAAGEEPPWEAQRKTKDEARKAKAKEARDTLETAIDEAGGLGSATVKDVAEILGIGERAVQKRISKMRNLKTRNGVINGRE